jgi:hypothetical protein
MTYGRLALPIAQFVSVFLLSACATAPYMPADMASVPFQDRAETQATGLIEVTAAVPGPEEARALFDLPLYDNGIQPVWLKVRNGSDDWIRYAPVSTDREYFSGQEVAYVHRGGFSGEARKAMNHHIYDMTMPRRIPPGESRSGFVFTHADPGTKAFNVDLFGASPDQDLSFTFFIDVPGFQPDHSVAYFEELYDPGQLRDFDCASLKAELATMDHQTRDSSGQGQGLPINVVVIGQPEQVLQALLRADWMEQPRTNSEMAAEQTYLFGRIADVVFSKERTASGGRTELQFWLSPMLESGKPVWFVEVTHHVGGGKANGQLDPDVDDAAAYFVQDMWYGQGLAAYGWIRGQGQVPIDNPNQSFAGEQYFTEGYLAVTWLSGPALSMLELNEMDWDEAPGRAEP